MTRTIIAAGLVVGVGACTGTGSTIPAYEPSSEATGSYTHEFDATREQIITAAKRAVVTRGYDVAEWDRSSGTLTTRAIRRRFEPTVADCGTLEGVGNPLASDSTKSRVYVGVVARDGAAAIHATIQAEYRVPKRMDYLSLVCVSNGEIEGRVAAAIREELDR